MSHRARSTALLAAVLWGVTACATPAAHPVTTAAGAGSAEVVTALMSTDEVLAAQAQARVLASESRYGDTATVLDEHTLVVTVFARSDCPARDVTATESAGRVVVEVADATGQCAGEDQPSTWRLTTRADLVAYGDPAPVTVVKDGCTSEVQVGGTRLTSSPTHRVATRAPMSGGSAAAPSRTSGPCPGATLVR